MGLYINNLIKTKNCRIHGLMCDIMIYQWQHRKMDGEEVLVDLFIVQSVHVKALCSVLAPSHSVKVQEPSLCVLYCQVHHS